jgi:integrase
MSNNSKRVREKAKEPRAKAKKMTFTELGLQRLRVPKKGKKGQEVHWDSGTKGQSGLSVLSSAGGTKTYRATFALNGKYISAKIGRVGEMDLAKARATTLEYRKLAASGIDPTKPRRAAKTVYEDVVAQFIEHYAKPRQRRWDQPERVLLRCESLLGRDITTITKQELRELLRGYVGEGKPYKAQTAFSWLKTLFKWAAQEDIVTSSPMEAVTIEIEKRERDRVYSDAEIVTTWNAASKLDPIESGYAKLLILLAPRKTALACLRRSHLDDPHNPTLWTTPHELTKSRKRSAKKRVYLTPLPPLAQRVIRGVPVDPTQPDVLFPSLPLYETRAGQMEFSGERIRRHLIEAGAPADFMFHAWRHTIATHFGNHSEWERGLLLNHSSSSVTGDYTHSQPLELKRKLLEQWADYIERLVSPKGAVLLR